MFAKIGILVAMICLSIFFLCHTFLKTREELKVSARVKKGEFSKFLISRHSDKPFQKLPLKKKFHKKNILLVQSYSLDVNIYYTLFMLITC